MQVGDPFMEKLVCEACLELLAHRLRRGMQDMGAGGLTCSTCEMAARAGTGIEIELDKVPQRAPNMSSYEIMLSESQERMLIVVHKGREEEVKRIFDKWDLPWSEIGIITDTRPHEGAVTAANSLWTFPRGKSPTNRRCISAKRLSRRIRKTSRVPSRWYRRHDDAR
ncbi:MAG: AIR synthase-related protein [Limisphaerales bacterium]